MKESAIERMVEIYQIEAHIFFSFFSLHVYNLLLWVRQKVGVVGLCIVLKLKICLSSLCKRNCNLFYNRINIQNLPLCRTTKSSLFSFICFINLKAS